MMRLTLNTFYLIKKFINILCKLLKNILFYLLVLDFLILTKHLESDLLHLNAQWTSISSGYDMDKRGMLIN